ncbi:UDP-glycosyltransferase family, conserved site [Sesbania bispinosa]|nr:UDP-glycosyltransferase family, conserved site [Sesbania bispinosa]
MAMTHKLAIMDSTPHFVFIPLMAPGHLLPMVDMAKLFARRKVKVSLLTTPLNSIQFQASIDREIQFGSSIQILNFQFPNIESGIAQGCESVDTLPSMDLLPNFSIALCMMQQPLEELFEKLTPFPSCIIADKHISCVADIANKLKVPRIIFDGTNCFHLLCNHNLHKIYKDIPDQGKFLVPGMPHRIEFGKYQLPGLFNPGTNHKVDDFRERIRVASESSYGIVVNSFKELEEGYVKEYQRVTGHKVWCVGPVSLSNKDNLDKAQRGLEATKRPFIWVIRGAYGREEMEKWLLEEGFEERVKGRGLLIKGWAPQVLILSHKAIGVFLTHCGWNSTLEGICAGVPLVTFPLFGEQFYNEKVVVQVVKSGVSVGAETVVHWGRKTGLMFKS